MIAKHYDSCRDGGERTQKGERHLKTTTGFRPTCTCTDNDGSGKCTVLDPFGGAGTTSLVAAKAGRNSIYIELNPAYRDMAAKRLRGEVDTQMSLLMEHEIVEVTGV